jgi:hypothetical protein
MTQITYRADSTDPLVPLAGRAVRSEIIRENFQVLHSAASLWAFDTVADVTSITRSGTTATVTQIAHGYSVTDKIIVAGANESAYNGTFAVASIVDADTYTYTVTGSPTTPATGTITTRRKNIIGITAGSYQTSGTVNFTYAGGFSPALDLNDTVVPLDGSSTPGVAGDRLIALLTIDAFGTLLWTKGNWANPGFPTAPLFPANKVPICQVLVTFDSIVSTITDNSLEIIDSLITDVRPLINLGGAGGGGCSDFACLGPLNADIEPLIVNDNVFNLGSATQRLKDGFFGGDVTIDGKLTVGGAIDPPTYLQMATTASGGLPIRTVFFDSGNSNKLSFINNAGGLVSIEENLISTLDEAYDGGGAGSGSGRTITADSGSVEINATNNIALQTAQMDNFLALQVTKTNVGSTGAAEISNDGTGPALDVNQNGNGIGLRVTKTNAGGAHVISITNSGSGDALQINQNIDGIAIEVLRTTIGVANVIQITNSGMGNALEINQHADGIGLEVNQTSAVAISDLIKINNSSAGTALRITQDGANSALVLNQNVNAIVLDINKTTTGSANIIDIDQSGSGYEIEGTGNLWNVDNRGHATVSTAISKLKQSLNGKATFSSSTRWQQMQANSVLGAAPTDRIAFGAVFDGRYVYYTPGNEQSILAYDTTRAFTDTASWERMGVTSAFGGAQADSISSSAGFDGRYFYISPNQADTFVRYDTTRFFTSTSSWEQISLESAQGNGNSGNTYGAVSFDGRYMYFCPNSGETMIRYDTTKAFKSSASWEQIAIDSAQGVVTVGNPGYGTITYDGRYMYYVPSSADTFLRFDTTTAFTNISSWTQMPMNSAQGAATIDGAYGGAIFDGRYVYFSVIDSTTFIRFDTTQPFTSISSWQQMPVNSATGATATTSAYGGGTSFDGRYVYFCAFSADTFIRFDTTESFTSISSWQQVAMSSAHGGAALDIAYVGPCFDGHYIYYAPLESDSFIRFLANNTSAPGPTEYDQVAS